MPPSLPVAVSQSQHPGCIEVELPHMELNVPQTNDILPRIDGLSLPKGTGYQQGYQSMALLPRGTFISGDPKLTHFKQINTQDLMQTDMWHSHGWIENLYQDEELNSRVSSDTKGQTSILDICISDCSEMLSIEETLNTLDEACELPSVDSCLSILQKCRQQKHLPYAKCAYAHICNNGLEALTTIGNFIVPMFVECGSMSTAKQVFNTLSYRSEHSWTSLMLGCIEEGELWQLFNLYKEMQHDHVEAKSYTFAALLRGCSSLKDVQKGRQIHFDVVIKGMEGDLIVGNTLISFYCRCGLLPEAHEIFEGLPIRDVVSWTTLISGYAENGHEQKVFSFLEDMHLNGVSSNLVTFACVLKACSSFGTLEKGREIHTEVTQKGFQTSLPVSNSIVGMYANCASLFEARKVLDGMANRDVVSWTALIAGYAEYGPDQEALQCYEQMKLENILPNVVTYACVLKACGHVGALQSGQEMHIEIVQKGYERDSSVNNSLVGMYARCGSLLEAKEMFGKLVVRDVVAWTALVAGYTEHGLAQEALSCIEQMTSEGVSPDAFTFACSLKACGCSGDIERGRQLHLEVAEQGLLQDLPVGNTLIDMYVKCGSLLEAHEVFDNLPARNIVSWTTLMGGYAENGHGQKVFDCFEKMQQEGVTPNEVTFACVFRACGNAGALEKGRQIHMDIKPYSLERDASVANSLIGMYGRCGSVSEAEEVFRRLPVKEVASWSSMIKCYGLNHEGNLAVQCFESMLEQGLKPDAVTLTCLLAACSHASLVKKGWNYFRKMIECFGIRPVSEHFTCLVGLLSRAGHLYEAEKLIEMFFPSSQRTWAALLSGCKTYGEEELAERCFDQLVHINPDVAAWYALMGDIYASAGKREDAYRVDQLRKHAGATKKSAIATIEVNKKLHQFMLGSHPSEEVSLMLNTLSLRMKDQGHVPNFDQVLRRVSDDDKEAALCEHVEKVAIAFGILNTSAGETLRVTKSLRTCNDCHNATKIISKVERREIILRDDCCIHRFKDGLCSCGDLF